jgi:ABC-type uncharacterized transport system permease subunit
MNRDLDDNRSGSASKHLKLLGLYFRYNLQSAMEYRASFITQALGMLNCSLSSRQIRK